MSTEIALPRILPRPRPLVTTVAKVETDWQKVADLDKAQAELLLDWLENNGFEQREITESATGRLTIRYRP